MDLGLSPADFWQTTPRAFTKMIRRFRDGEWHADYRAAMIALPLINRGREQHEMLSMGDVFPSLKPKPKSTQTSADHFAVFRMWAAAGYGRIG